MEHIVVGVDGSPAALEALRWAVGEAALRQAELRVVTVTDQALEESPYAASYAYAPDLQTADRLSDDERRWRERQQHQIHERAERQLDAMIEQLGEVDVTLHREVIGGSRAAQALIDRARHAQLLVVGSRGRGGFRGLLLGSVSQQCVQHASCPVVVVHQQPADKATRR